MDVPSPRRIARPPLPLGSRLPLALALLAGALALPVPGALGAVGAPTVLTEGTSNVTYSSATLFGGVDARGLFTSYSFQYGSGSGYGGPAPPAPAGNGPSMGR